MKKIQNILSEKVDSLKKIDYIILLCIVLVYGTFSFFRLGNLKSPNTFYSEDAWKEIVFEFDDSVDIIRMKYFNGCKETQFRIYTSNDNETYEFIQEEISRGTFTWDNVGIGRKAKYVKFILERDSSFGEVAFYTSHSKRLSYSSNNAYLMDETELIPEQLSYMSSSYFDEVYFARDAYELKEGIPLYEWTHPPLGKIIQAIPILITNYFSPFLYRMMGNISGIIMLVVMYFYGITLFHRRGYGLLASIFMGVDTFHFTQTRMGTVDSHLVLFIMLSVLFMIYYGQTDKNKYLFLSGLFFGLSVCVKWTGFYAGLGLAIFYFVHFIKKKKEIIESIVKGSVFFVVIPLILYCSFYFLFPNNLHYTNSFEQIIEEQKSMYNFHSSIKEVHYFSSKWYTWPISYKPVWYHIEELPDMKEETISALGNLVLWYGGILGFFYCLYKVFARKEKVAMYLVLFILSLWLPYSFIGRCMFLYHYFPVLPFLFLTVVYLLKDITEGFHLKYIIPVYVTLAFIFFVIYYPVTSGLPTKMTYIDKLQLFESWHFH